MNIIGQPVYLKKIDDDWGGAVMLLKKRPAQPLEHFSKYYSHMRTGELLVRAARAVRAIGMISLRGSLARI